MNKKELAESMQIVPGGKQVEASFSFGAPRYSVNVDQGFFNQRRKRESLNKSMVFGQTGPVRADSELKPVFKNYIGHKLKFIMN